MSYIDQAKRVFDLEIEALKRTRDALDSTFDTFIEAYANCEGKIIVVGTGKSGQIARKIASTLSSLGTASCFMNSLDALHGDLGMVSDKDIMLFISHSGETDEIVAMLPVLKKKGIMISAITGAGDSTLAKEADIVEVYPDFQEACHLGLAPTSSTTTALCFGDALAVATSIRKNFRKEDFKINHPCGALGKK